MAGNSPPDLSQLLDRELWIVTAVAEGRQSGLTASWVAPASLDSARPLLLLGLGPNHFTTKLVLASKQFVAHLLREDQVALAWNFARDSGRQRDKLANVELQAPPDRADGPAVLQDCLAWWHCRLVATYSTGDRLLVWGETVASGAPGPERAAAENDRRAIRPLRERSFFANLGDDQRRLLKANRDQDMAGLQALHEEWKRSVQS